MKCCEAIWTDEAGAERRFYVYGASIDEYMRAVLRDEWRPHDEWRFVDVKEIKCKAREEGRQGGRRPTNGVVQVAQHFFDPYLGRLGTVARGADPDTLFARVEGRCEVGLGGGALV